ncbi:metallophosphoesterase, partial [Candidatus Woesearchaeota archaeon]|nr:metallophosphoesterase [Candidatus Woesearchaeota archaeon]
MDSEQKKKYIGLLLERNILVEPSKLNIYTEDDFRALLGLKSEVEAANTEQAHNAAAAPALEMHESEKENPKIIEKPKPTKPDGKVKIVFNYQDEYKKREVQDFVSYFNKRFESLRNMLRERRELNNITSINKLLAKKDKAEMSLIGIILNIQKTKNGHIMLTLEDKTGSINVLVNKNRQDLMEIAQELVLDEVIGISGTVADKIIFSNKIVLPDVIMNKEFKKSPDEAYAVFISDLHVGAKKFMAENVDKFIDWLKGNVGNDVQKNMASKVKYLFIAGDLVEGVGIFPEQESELEVKDIYDQFKLCAEYLKKIPSHIHIILCPGNHDPVRLVEPQPVIPREYAKPL